jgi:hypothetical protein
MVFIKKRIAMNDNSSSKKTQDSKKETFVAHAPWQLEKDTEGLDNPSQSATSGSTSGSKEEEKENESSGCACKYF